MVQRQEARPASAPARSGAGEDWTDVVFRPDIFAAPVQARASGAAPDAETVHEAAQRGMESGGGGLPHAGVIQQAFGRHDVSQVQAHVGGAATDACATMGAAAYASGDHVAFAGAPDLHTVAHEAAHVVQQRSGVALSGGVGQAGDSYERHADRVADAVVAGQSAEGLLDQASATGGSPSRAVQRFESNEHKLMGDEGSRTAQGQTRTVEVAPGYFLTFGDLTAMAGDFFGSVEQLKKLAQKDGTGAGTREEVEYVRVVKVHGHEAREASFSQAARDAVMKRYYELAGNNSTHFTEPNGQRERTSLNNAGNYRDNHESAVSEAARAAAAGQSIDQALLLEGFASHYLTDSYAAGHVRTERISISDWWNPKVPMFWTNLKLFIAEEMARYINDNTTLAGGLKTVQQLWEQVRETIAQKDLPTLTFGDLVSGAVHDYDNVNGVATQHGRLLGDGRILNHEGQRVQHNDPAHRAAAQNTANLAIAAVRLSLEEVERAYTMGSSQAPDQVVATLRGSGEYAAEQIWPQASPQSQQPVPRPPWQQNDVASLIADPAMKEAIEIFAHEKADSLEEAMTFEDVTALGGMITAVSGALQARGFRERITNPLRSDSIALLQRIIDYTPNTGGGVGGHDTDDNAMEYIEMARDAGALPTLTQVQRVKLIRDLVAGVCGDDEEQAIIELLQTTSASVMTAIVRELGGGDAKKGINYLDSGVDGAEWRTLKTVLSRSQELKVLL